ncbi:MAG: hypothetical protein WCK32_05070 [Chlorobiaceae bacterium]
MPKENETPAVTLKELFNAFQAEGQSLLYTIMQNPGFFVKIERLTFPFHYEEKFHPYDEMKMDIWGEVEMFPIEPHDSLSDMVEPKGIDTRGIAYASKWIFTDCESDTLDTLTGDGRSYYREKIYF